MKVAFKFNSNDKARFIYTNIGQHIHCLEIKASFLAQDTYQLGDILTIKNR